MQHLPVGKLPASLLARLLRRYALTGPDVILGPAVGEDAAALAVGGRVLIAAADPVTFAVEDIGWYAVTVNANDVATRGASPRWFLSVVMLPEGRTSAETAEPIFKQIHRACQELGVSWIGGHTEITAGLKRPIIAGTMLGIGDRGDLIRTSGAKPGDVLLLTKGLAIEAAALLAREKAAELRRHFPAEFLHRCRNLLRRLGVVREAHLALRHGHVHAMHDPTEGGLSTALYELAEASSTALEVDAAEIPVLEEAAALCRHFGMDPLGALASGSLLLSVKARDAERIVRGLLRSGIDCRPIGRVKAGSGVRLLDARRGRAFPRFERDELARVL